MDQRPVRAVLLHADRPKDMLKVTGVLGKYAYAPKETIDLGCEYEGEDLEQSHLSVQTGLLREAYIIQLRFLLDCELDN